MSRKSGIDPEVMQSDLYTSQTIAAQALYPQILMESDTMGVVVGIRRVVRASGIPDAADALNELIENGYVVPLDIDGNTVHVIRHYFIHNNYQRKYAERSKFYERLPQYIKTPAKGGELYGAPCEHGTCTVRAQAEQSRAEGEQSGEELSRDERSGGEGNRGGEPGPRPIQCPMCMAEMHTGQTVNGYVQVECVDCGFIGWFDRETGDFVDNPYPRR